MKIADHRIEGVKFVATDNMGGTMTPEYVIIHYTATQGASGVISAFQGMGGATVSAHLVVDTDGTVTQMVPFNRVAWHAGKSQWGGKSGCNQFTIGIEIVNPGYLTKSTNGYLDSGSRPYKGEVVEARHKNTALKYSHWAAYTPEQISAVSEICQALFQAYPLRGVAGHDDISPGRKFDPGPAYPLRQLQSLVEGRRDDGEPRYRTSTQLNVREGAGVNFAQVPGSPLASGTEVLQVDASDPWWHVTTPDGTVEGWVHSRFLVAV